MIAAGAANVGGGIMRTAVLRICLLGLVIVVLAVQALLGSGAVKSFVPVPPRPAHVAVCVDWPDDCP